MRDRLLKFMEAEHLQASRLAEILGVQPATISHILNGRNRPSFEFIEKLLQRFPKMNPDWLILGKGNIYRPELQNPYAPRSRDELISSVQSLNNTTTSESSASFSTLPKDLFTETPQNSPQSSNKNEQLLFDDQNNRSNPEKNSTKSQNELSDTEPSTQTNTAQIQDSDIERIVIFLKNGTCISYKPR